MILRCVPFCWYVSLEDGIKGGRVLAGFVQGKGGRGEPVGARERFGGEDVQRLNVTTHLPYDKFGVHTIGCRKALSEGKSSTASWMVGSINVGQRFIQPNQNERDQRRITVI